MIVLSSYPLSRGSLDALALPDDAQCLTLNTLRLEPPFRLIRRLREARTEVWRVVVQEPSERAVLPLMLALSALVPAGRIEVQDLSSERISTIGRVRAALGLLGVFAATIGGRLAIWRLGRHCSRLLREEPLEFGRVPGERAIYLKTNLMLGAKAGGSIGHIAGVVNELWTRDPSMVLVAPEFPPMVDDRVQLRLVPALRAYGFPAEINHFRFNEPCLSSGEQVLASGRFDFIYQRLTLGNLAGVLLSRKHGLPLVVEYNGSEVWVARHWGYRLKHEVLASRIEDVCLRHAHRVIAVSRVLADELVARGVPAERVVWYPNGIDPQQFDPQRHAPARQELRRSHSIEDDEIVCLFIGTFGAWHGAEILAEAARLCLSNSGDGPRLRFVFVGDGLRQPVVREMLSSEIARGQAIFTGLVPQHEAPRWLAAADIYCSPHVTPADGSEFFGSPTKLFEYMAMAGAIVASHVAQIGEVLSPALSESSLGGESGEREDATAVLVPPGDAEALARVIRHLARRPELRRSLGCAARAKALEHYTWRRHVDTILESLH